jgi:hypothetical protein
MRASAYSLRPFFKVMCLLLAGKPSQQTSHTARRGFRYQNQIARIPGAVIPGGVISVTLTLNVTDGNSVHSPQAFGKNQKYSAHRATRARTCSDEASGSTSGRFKISDARDGTNK